MKKISQNAGRGSQRYLKALDVVKRKGLRGIKEILFYLAERGRKTKVRCRPQTATISIEGRCNFMCKYCMYHGELANTGYRNYTYTFDQIRKEIDILMDYGVGYIHLCGTGEPFLNRDIFKMFKYIRRKGGATSVLTNGSSAVMGKLDKIVEAGLKYYKTDIDTVDEDEYAVLTGKPELKHVIDNLRGLVGLRAKRNSGLRLEVNTILTRQSLPRLPEILRVLIDIGVDRWNLTQLLIGYEDRGVLTRKNKMMDDREEVYVSMCDLETMNKGRIKIAYPQYFDIKKDVNALICYRFWNSIMLNVPNYNMPVDSWYGNVVLGCTDNKTHDYPLGNVFADSMDDIWNGVNMRNLRSAIIDNSDEECRELCLSNRFE